MAELAGQFSPLIEKPDAEMVVFSLAGLSRMFGDWRQIASEISRRGADMGIVANLAIARDKTTAMLAARHLRGVTIIPPGREAASLSEISIEDLPAEPEMLATLRRWGIRTLGNLGALPEIGVRERLGEAGCRLRRIALGQEEDWLRLSRPPEEYTAREEFDYPVELLEPLLFVIAAQLRDLTAKLQRNGQAVRRIAIAATLDPSGETVRSVELPLSMRDPQALLKQIQLCLEAKPLGAPVTAIQVALDPADPRVVQGGLFQPTAPEPEKLQTLLTRLGALAGPDRVGSPVILDSHRPDAFRLRPCAFESANPSPVASRSLRLAFRYFRPPLPARVKVENSVPRRIASERVSGAVLHAAGPWRTSGEWWADTSWMRDEWDVALESQAAYRIYLTPSQEWFVEGSYD
jgi:protein ImuB